MKYIASLIVSILLVTSCKKEPFESAFLYGRLIDDCNGKAVAGQKVQFYRNFQEGATWLQPNTQTELLEEVVTDENGYFYFTGEDYTNKSTMSISNSSIRLETGDWLATGILGKGTGAEKEEGFYQHNVGDVILNGMQLDLQLKIATKNYDSVKIFNSFFDVNMIVSEVQDGYFIGQIPDQTLRVKNFWADENDTKYNIYLAYSFYYDGGKLTDPVYHEKFVDQCSTSLEMVYEH
jgi:hypothetical protein